MEISVLHSDYICSILVLIFFFKSLFSLYFVYLALLTPYKYTYTREGQKSSIELLLFMVITNQNYSKLLTIRGCTANKGYAEPPPDSRDSVAHRFP